MKVKHNNTMDGIQKQIDAAQVGDFCVLTTEKLEKAIKDIESNHTEQDLTKTGIVRYCLYNGCVIGFDLKLCSNPNCDSCRAIDKSLEEAFKEKINR